MLKKQTVWLLTMLSLMVVLSVYYILSPGNNDLAYIDDGKKTENKETTVDSAAEEGDATVEDISPGKDELFTTLRMDLDDDRSRAIARLKEVVAASEVSTEEKNKALDDITEIEQTTTKETTLEKTIIAANEYEDVLVRSNGEKVHVHVKIDKLTNEEVVQIMQMVRDEFGDVKVDVNYQQTEG
ncbi:SpoIIIAH-like family protein [Virgibacillus soli]|uniref:SpoIIIAH-like family protein n=1 Tax=Paracerasibacillus soli TaxID=480284 RepID=A0ABU5CRA2_9BACI|nr:SpoIIIAH-like family protein [Virgibacillus soli]MDY0408401.1 SpoIIIAH-like family protein [Virgibacillus soli]